MRIISGSLKGAYFDSPHGRRTHPMSDRVRGALFNALGDVSGLTVFDPFGGTGALAFEAVSRGAVSAVVCELDKQAQKTIVQNIDQLNLALKVEMHFGNVKSWLRRNVERTFDLVLADPPYDDIDPALLRLVAARTVPGGIFVVSWPGKEAPLFVEGLELVQTNGYGDAQLLFFRRR